MFKLTSVFLLFFFSALTNAQQYAVVLKDNTKIGAKNEFLKNHSSEDYYLDKGDLVIVLNELPPFATVVPANDPKNQSLIGIVNSKLIDFRETSEMMLEKFKVHTGNCRLIGDLAEACLSIDNVDFDCRMNLNRSQLRSCEFDIKYSLTANGLGAGQWNKSRVKCNADIYYKKFSSLGWRIKQASTIFSKATLVNMLSARDDNNIEFRFIEDAQIEEIKPKSISCEIQSSEVGTLADLN